ncbi:MAG: J domain-containing protein [Isosphaeraceae bacterium]
MFPGSCSSGVAAQGVCGFSAERKGGRIVIEPDPYTILGVARGCTPEEAREAYRAGVRATHPDHGGDGVAFIRLCAAYRQVVEELEHPADDPAARPQTGSGATPTPGLDRKAYVAWVREHARNSSRRKSRSHSRGGSRRPRHDRPWWRRHPKAARSILFGLVAAFGLSILGFTLLLGPGLIDRAERRARERSRARTAAPPPPSRVIAGVPASRPDRVRQDGPRGEDE